MLLSLQKKLIGKKLLFFWGGQFFLCKIHYEISGKNGEKDWRLKGRVERGKICRPMEKIPFLAFKSQTLEQIYKIKICKILV